MAYTRGAPGLAADAVVSGVQFAGDDRVGAAYSWWRGHQDAGGGEFMWSAAHVLVTGDEGIERYEYFDADDEDAAGGRLLALQPDPDVRSAWAPQLAMLTALNTRDWARLRAGYTEDAHLVDHRRGGSTANPAEAVRSLVDGMPDGRAAIQFLDAGRDRAISRLHIYGRDAEIAIGQVIRLREGRIAHVELFEPDDEAGMRTCFEQSTPPTPRDRPGASSLGPATPS
jgi:hypothetical protein